MNGVKVDMKLPNYAKSGGYIGRGLETFNLRSLLFRDIKNKLKEGRQKSKTIRNRLWARDFGLSSEKRKVIY